MQEVTLRGFAVESTTITLPESTYRDARREERLDHELDVYLSDMDGPTFVVGPEGTPFNPYRAEVIPPDGLLDIIEPLLALLPVATLRQYLADRTEKEDG